MSNRQRLFELFSVWLFEHLHNLQLSHDLLESRVRVAEDSFADSGSREYSRALALARAFSLHFVASSDVLLEL